MSWGLQAGWCCLGDDGGRDEGSIKAEIYMGLVTNGAFDESTGQEKIKTFGAGVMRDMTKSMKGNYFMGRDIL